MRRSARRPLAALALPCLGCVVFLVAATDAAPPRSRPAAHAAVGRDTTQVHTVAILYFDNATGDASYDAIGRGISAMLTSDLSEVPAVRLVERDRLQAVLEEQGLQRSQMADPATAVRTGKLLGAEYLLTGAVTASRPKLRVDSRVVRVETGQVVSTATAVGQEDKFFELQQKLARQIVTALPTAVSPEALEALRRRQEADRIDNVRTVVAFSDALTRYDSRDYVGAAERLAPVMRDAGDVTVVRLTFAEARRRSAAAAGNVLKAKANERLRSIFRRP